MYRASSSWSCPDTCHPHVLSVCRSTPFPPPPSSYFPPSLLAITSSLPPSLIYLLLLFLLFPLEPPPPHPPRSNCRRLYFLAHCFPSNPHFFFLSFSSFHCRHYFEIPFKTFSWVPKFSLSCGPFQDLSLSFTTRFFLRFPLVLCPSFALHFALHIFLGKFRLFLMPTYALHFMMFLLVGSFVCWWCFCFFFPLSPLFHFFLHSLICIFIYLFIQPPFFTRSSFSTSPCLTTDMFLFPFFRIFILQPPLLTARYFKLLSLAGYCCIPLLNFLLSLLFHYYWSPFSNRILWLSVFSLALPFFIPLLFPD